MARPRKTDDRSRLNLDLPSDTKDRLVRLRDMTHADSLGEVVRRSAELYEKLVEHHKQGKRFFIDEREILIL